MPFLVSGARWLELFIIAYSEAGIQSQTVGQPGDHMNDLGQAGHLVLLVGACALPNTACT